MAKRISVVNYKVNGQPVSSPIFINNIQQEDIENNSVILRINTDEEGNIVRTTNQNNEEQYALSLPKENGAYAYIKINDMKALKATGNCRKDSFGRIWVKLVLAPVQPRISDFNRMETINEF